MKYFPLIFFGLLLPGDVPKYASFAFIILLVKYTDIKRYFLFFPLLFVSFILSYEPFVTLQTSLKLILALALGSLMARENIQGFSGLMSKIGIYYIFFPLLVVTVFGPGALESVFTKIYTKSLFDSNIRYCGIFGNPNHLSLVAVAVVPFLLKNVLENRSYLALAALVSCVVSLYLSASRAGIILSFSQISFYLFSGNEVKKYIKVLLFLPLLFIISIWFFQPVIERTETLTIDSLTENRQERWTLGIGSIKRNLIFGQGLGVGGVNSYQDLQRGSYSKGYMLHNSYLSILQELGVFMGFFAIWQLVLKPLMVAHRLGRAVFLSFVGLLLHGMTESFMLYAANPGSMLLLILVNLILYNATDYQ